jgi:predicted dehydrogenase
MGARKRFLTEEERRMKRQRYGIVGTGMRARMYVEAITTEHADVAELVALVDSNPGRTAFHAAAAERAGAPAPAQYAPADLEQAIADQRVDRVIVSSPDDTHAEMIVRALDAGADVVVEKPLTIDAAGCAAITEAVARTGRSVVVTFNYRYSPRNSALKELIASGAVGRVTSVHFEWLLDTKHGADYFRRWHREKAHSGGLLVHKASHHFDLVNWWIADSPRRVFASGGLRFYGEAVERGPRPGRGTVEGSERDPFLLDLRTDPTLRALYLDTEQHDGYRRDLDVFSPGITIEDNLAVVVEYDGGPSMSYSLNAHAPWEGYVIGINGTEGRAELTVVERGAVFSGNSIDPSATPGVQDDPGLRPPSERLTVQRHWGPVQEVAITDGGGAHGGGDVRMLADIFRGPGADPLGRPAGYVDGLRAVAVGIAGNRSLLTGEAISVADLGLGADLTTRADVR